MRVALLGLGLLLAGCLSSPAQESEPQPAAWTTIEPASPEAVPPADTPPLSPPLLPKARPAAAPAPTTQAPDPPPEDDAPPPSGPTAGDPDEPTTNAPPPPPPPPPPPTAETAYHGTHTFEDPAVAPPPAATFARGDERLPRVRLIVDFERAGDRPVVIAGGAKVVVSGPAGDEAIVCAPSAALTQAQRCESATDARPGTWSLRYEGVGTLKATAWVLFTPD